MKAFEIFKTGKHTSSQGEALAFADDDLKSIAGSYDPAIHHAPIVVGHPKQDGPAYGWIDSLAVKAGKLVAVPGDIDPAFSDLVRDGKFKKVSAAFYKPDSANNPVPGSWYLRHVGFLGAAAPAIKGLKPIEFSDAGDTEFADIEFGEWKPMWLVDTVARLFRSLRDNLIETTDLETANRVLPQWDVDDLATTAANLRAEASNAAYSDEKMEEELAMTIKTALAQGDDIRADLEAREAALKIKEAAFAEVTKAATATADAAFVDTIITAGRLPIGLKAQAVALFGELSDEAVTFSDGGTDISASPREVLRDILAKLPIPVVLGEIATGDGPDFSDTQTATATIRQEIDDAAAKGEKISPAEAASRLQAKG